MMKKKDDRFTKASEQIMKTLNFGQNPNFHASGSVEGMRRFYYGMYACLVQVGDYIYHVEDKTFAAVKDMKYLQAIPGWVQEAAKQHSADEAKEAVKDYETELQHIVHEKENTVMLFCKQLDLKVNNYDGFLDILHRKAHTDEQKLNLEKAKLVKVYADNGNRHWTKEEEKLKQEILCHELHFQAKAAEQLAQRIKEGISDVKLSDIDNEGRIFLYCKVDGEQQMRTRLSLKDSAALYNLPPSELARQKVDMAAKYHLDKLWVATEEQVRKMGR